MPSVQRVGAVASIRPVVAGGAQLAFAQAAAEDGITLGSGTFDWLCEQGHVGSSASRRPGAILQSPSR